MSSPFQKKEDFLLTGFRNYTPAREAPLKIKRYSPENHSQIRRLIIPLVKKNFFLELTGRKKYIILTKWLN